MKLKFFLVLILMLPIYFIASSQSILDRVKNNMTDRLGKLSGTGVGSVLQKQPAITTNFKDDASLIGSLPSSFTPPFVLQQLQSRPKTDSGAYKLCAGYYEISNKSYCLQAGTHGPSTGHGYVYAPLKGPKQDLIHLILQRAAQKRNVEQHDIQVILWAIIAHTSLKDISGRLQLIIASLLTPQEIISLNGGALGLIPQSVLTKGTAMLPPPVQAILQAENNIRQLVSSGNATFEQMESYAILAGIAPNDRPDVTAGVWCLHPDGYYIRYFPSGYSKTKTQIYVPQKLCDYLTAQKITLIYDATNDIACPASTGSQRLVQSNEEILNP